MNLIRVVKNIFLGKAVCKKHNLNFKISTNVDGQYNHITQTVTIDPFRDEFVSTLFHEIGHHVHHKLVDYNTFFNVDENCHIQLDYLDHYKVLEAESFASRFALKTKRANKAFLIKSFNTYTKEPLKYLDLYDSLRFPNYIDAIHKCSKRIMYV